MTQAQEAKLDKVYEVLMDLKTDVAVHATKHQAFQTAIADLTKDQVSTDLKLQDVIDAHNKVKGATWAIGAVGSTGLIASIYSFFKHL